MVEKTNRWVCLYPVNAVEKIVWRSHDGVVASGLAVGYAAEHRPLGSPERVSAAASGVYGPD